MNLLILILFSSISAHQFDDYEWKIYKVQDDITVYKASSQHKSGLVPIRAKATLNYPLAKIISVMSDGPKKQEWVPKQAENIVVSEPDAYSRIEYSRYTAPWPLKDRTFLIDIKGKYDQKTQILTITMQSTEHPDFPINDKYIRGHTYRGRIELHKKGPNKTEFETWLITDFKGSIPNWVINLLQAKWPFKMISLLKKQLEKPETKILEKYKPLLD